MAPRALSAHGGQGTLHVAGKPQASLPGQPAPMPLEKPDFDLKTLRAAIPAHCFERSAVKSMMWLARDLVLIAIIGYAGTLIDTPYVPAWARYIAWPLYWYLQGLVMTGVWVLAHECGHQAFSDSALLNDTVGWVLHSALLVPYFRYAPGARGVSFSALPSLRSFRARDSWAISHGNHHKNTNSCEHDEVFNSPSRSKVAESVSDSPIAHLAGIIGMLLFGWPLYLLFNVAGPPKYEGKRNSHFDAGAVLWLQKQGFSVNLSTIGVLLGLAGLAYWSVTWGFLHMVKFYFVPYLIVNAHLVLITFLQHTDTYVPHYRGESFDWLQGALCTVDRPFGAFVDHMLHHITDTHVCHHVFSKMPFYHATEATEAMKPVLGKYYLRDETPIWLATWNSASRCKFVEDEGDVVWYQGPSALSAKKAD